MFMSWIIDAKDINAVYMGNGLQWGQKPLLHQIKAEQPGASTTGLT